MATEKMTNKKALEWVLEKVEGLPADVRGKLENMIASLEKKAAPGTKKPTAKQVENEGYRADILAYMAENPNQLFTCTEIGKKVASLEGMQNQRISALMKGLVDSKAVNKILDKGKSLFQYAAKTEGDEG